MRLRFEFSIEGGWSPVRHRFKGPTGAAKQQGNLLNTQATQQGQMATTLFGQAQPAIQQDINNPGYNTQQQNAIINSGIQAANAPFASAADQAARTAAQSRDSAGVDVALDSMARQKAIADANAAQQAQIDIANNAQSQRQQGIADTSQLFGTTEGTMANLYGATTPLFGQQQPSVLGQLGSAALGAAGVAACWVAAELYGGWSAPEVPLIREWLRTTFYMRPFWKFYGRYGKRWAEAIQQSRALRRATQTLFDFFLARARA